MTRDLARVDPARADGTRGSLRSSLGALPILPSLLLAVLFAVPLAAQDAAKSPLHTPVVAKQDDGFGPPPPPATQGPKMVIVQTEFDWGQVLHGEVVEHSYAVRNDGDDVLRITSVKPG